MPTKTNRENKVPFTLNPLRLNKIKTLHFALLLASKTSDMIETNQKKKNKKNHSHFNECPSIE